MFDFLKKEKRGTVIQTDDTGRIATMPTDDGRSRIISRDEYDRLNTMQGRRFAETPRQPSLDPREGQYAQQENIAMRNALQAQAQGIRSVPTESKEDMFERLVALDLGSPISQVDQRFLGRGSTPKVSMRQDIEDPFDRGYRGLGYDQTRINQIRDLVRDRGKYDTSESYTPYRDEDYGAPLQPKDDPFSYFDQTGPDRSEGTMDSKVIDPPLNKKTEVTKYFEEQFGGDKKMAEDAYKSFFGQPTEGIGSLPSRILSPLARFGSSIQGMPTYNKDGTPNLANMAKFYQATQSNLARQRLDRAREKDPVQMAQQTPLDPCPPNFRLDPVLQQCVPVAKEQEEIKNIFAQNPQSMQAYLNQYRPEGMAGDVPLNMYGRLGGEYSFFAKDGGSANVPRGDAGEVTGAGGPKDDLVGPFMLSNKEYVLPNEQIRMYGGGNYETGVKRLEQDRMNALSNFA
tara:strand:+ start:4753 stop:6123 length:1371 start_codon:yes stop_codon:yes gene_type:complete